MGDSRGRWDGDSLVVDVATFTTRPGSIAPGTSTAKTLHVTERYSPPGRIILLYEVTIEDPKVFTRPWKMHMPLYRRQEPNTQLLEYECYAYAREGRDDATAR